MSKYRIAFLIWLTVVTAVGTTVATIRKPVVGRLFVEGQTGQNPANGRGLDVSDSVSHLARCHGDLRC